MPFRRPHSPATVKGRKTGTWSPLHINSPILTESWPTGQRRIHSMFKAWCLRLKCYCPNFEESTEIRSEIRQ